MRFITIAVFFACSFNAYAGSVDATGTIQRLYTYSEIAGYDGDVAIKMSNPMVGCEGGFWLRKSTSEGYRSAVAFLLSAFHAGATVEFRGLDNEVWSGSSAKYCRLESLGLVK